jgi:hypothetical protein
MFPAGQISQIERWPPLMTAQHYAVSTHGDLPKMPPTPRAATPAGGSCSAMFSISLVYTHGAVGAAKSPTIGGREYRLGPRVTDHRRLHLV